MAIRYFLLLPLMALSLWAQAPGGKGAPPKNLKVLPANADVPFVMRSFTQALGVQCAYCHVQGDFASDANPKKDIARKMIGMISQIDATFPSSAGKYPAGYHEVDCITCHRGSAKPETKATKEFFNRNESLGLANPGTEPGKNLKVLPADTRVHGDGSIMHDFRDALFIDCGFCHGGGKPFEADENPRKEIARNMVKLVRQINTNFPGTGVYPAGNQAVTCFTCHRGETDPPSVGNATYPAPEKK